MTETLDFEIETIDYDLFQQIQTKIDRLAMPVGSLGDLHSLAKKIVGITRNTSPNLDKFTIIVFAADHGITQQGVSAYSHEVTYYNTINMLEGRATINAFAKSVNAKLIIVDSGINSLTIQNKSDHVVFIDNKVAFGTKDCSVEPAMKPSQVVEGILNGYNIVNKIAPEVDIIGIGEMGIGNTSIASLLISIILNIPIEDITGAGAGLNEKGIERKTLILKKTLNRLSKKSFDKDIINLLSEIGGHEINGMIGAILGAAKNKKPVLIDGVISSVAALAASLINKNINEYLIFCTKSTEPGHSHIYKYFSQNPILSLGLRLGEATGVALAYPVIKSAITQLTDIAELTEISVDKPNPEGFITKWKNLDPQSDIKDKC